MLPTEPPSLPAQSQTVATLLRNLVAVLANVAEDGAWKEAQAIVESTCGLDPTQQHLRGGMQLSALQVQRATALAHQRSQGEPLAYVLGSVYFYNRPITVDCNVLIPRPDSEVLVQTILDCQNLPTRCHFIDIGTGSGALTAALLQERPHWWGVALDISQDALRCARRNLGAQAPLVCADLCSALRDGAQFDFIVSNPPYIADSAFYELDHSVRAFEPQLALRGGADGLRFYRMLAAQAPLVLKAGGRIFCEIGFDQGTQAQSIFSEHPWALPQIIPDLAGRSRVLSAQRVFF